MKALETHTHTHTHGTTTVTLAAHARRGLIKREWRVVIPEQNSGLLDSIPSPTEGLRAPGPTTETAQDRVSCKTQTVQYSHMVNEYHICRPKTSNYKSSMEFFKIIMSVMCVAMYIIITSK